MEDISLIIINEKDNVAVALHDIKAGEEHNGIKFLNDIPFGHKVAIKNISTCENIIKYGFPIGYAKNDIKMGEHVHTHNLHTNLNDIIDYEYNPIDIENNNEVESDIFFDGYKRADGKVGTRNEVWIIPTVGCVNNTAKTLENMASKKFGDRCDGIFAYTHNMGCSQTGNDQIITQKLLSGIIKNPNAGGVLIVSLGCENNNLEIFKPFLEGIDKNKIRFLITQDVEDEYKEGMKYLDELTEYASTFKREKVPIKYLTIGFKCGGSDAFSGITANVVCGKLNNIFIKNGGSSILTETPEMFGAETILMSRAINKKVFDNMVNLINGYKNYFKKYGETIYENPSPGNKKGGISSLEEKSLGCVQKGGTSPIVDILDYGEYISKSGLNILKGSGNDQVSCTNLTASGANIILFTTGRGTPFGSIVPTLKISSNSNLYQKKNNWIDFNAGKVLENIPVDDIVKELFELVINIASGKIKTKNEINGYKEISIFRDGIIL